MRSRPPDRWVPGQVALPSRSTDPAEGSIASQRLSQTGRDRPTPSSLSEAILGALGGLREAIRFFHTVNPAITRKRTFDGAAIKGYAPLRVESIEHLGFDLPMVDITTGTGDFIADGVVSHNCFARPTQCSLR